MNNNVQIKRALVSVSDKKGIVEFCKALSGYGIEIISTGGTANVLKEAGIPVIDVATVTAYPEMLDGRVKTLHPVVHGGLLGVRDKPGHIASMEKHDIEPIDLLCIDLYPFEETICKENVSDEEVIEQIDIGGPAMIRSGAKNHAYVTVVTDPRQYSTILHELDSNDVSISYDCRKEFAYEAFARTASYDHVIQQWMRQSNSGIHAELTSEYREGAPLRYGENPDQKASVFIDKGHSGPSVINANTIAGKPLSYNNIMDAAAALEIVQDLATSTNLNAATIIKHANPCGTAVHQDLAKAFGSAWKCDTLAAFGGIVALSGNVDEELASQIAEGEKFLEVIVAPSIDNTASTILSGRWKNVRLLEVGNLQRSDSWLHYRSFEGGMLVQELHPVCAIPEDWKHMAGPEPTSQQRIDAIVAWIACAHLKSNSISIVNQGALIGGGMGQVDRVSAATLAISRAGKQLQEAQSPVAGSDAFFPFPDAPQLLIDAGITCLIQPGGSVRDQETIELCDRTGVTLLHTGSRRFRH